MNPKYLKIFLCFICLTGFLFSQSLTSQLGLNAGFSMPLGDFAQKGDSPTAGFAQFGFGGGAEFDLIVGESGIAWSTSFHYIANDYQTDGEFKWIPDFQLQDTGTYSNYALFTGAKYIHDLSDKFALFAVGQIGMNRATGPFFGGYAVDNEDNIALVEIEMGNHTTQGFGVGVGFIANRTTTFSVRYFSLGTATFSSSTTYTIGDERETVNIEWDQPISMILLTVGYTIDFGD